MLACLVDGAPVDLIVKSVIGGFEATGLMPPRKDSGGSVLTFICPAVESPAALGFADQRQLGLSFRLLTVETGENGAFIVQNAAPPAAAAPKAAPVQVEKLDLAKRASDHPVAAPEPPVRIEAPPPIQVAAPLPIQVAAPPPIQVAAPPPFVVGANGQNGSAPAPAAIVATLSTPEASVADLSLAQEGGQ